MAMLTNAMQTRNQEEQMMHLFSNFLQFMQITTNPQRLSPEPQFQLPYHNQNSQNFSNLTNTFQQSIPTVPQNFSNNFSYQTSPLHHQLPYNTSPQNQFNQHGINAKQMSYISSSLEKRKIFFTGKPGQDPFRFIQYLTECASSMAISDVELYNSLPVVLHGEALDWFRLNKINFPTFEQFKKHFVLHFSPRNYQERLIQEAYSRQQGKNEPISSFITSIRLIFE